MYKLLATLVVAVVGLLLIATAGCGSSNNGSALSDARHVAYNRGYVAGQEASGRNADARATAAYRRGVKAGENSLLDGDVSPGHWYALHVTAVKPLDGEISPMHPSTFYELCVHDASTVCAATEGELVRQIVDAISVPSGSTTTLPLPPGPSLPPVSTTDTFGSGNGYPVTCADGTVSDSGGIQGACSHHGGVP